MTTTSLLDVLESATHAHHSDADTVRSTVLFGGMTTRTYLEHLIAVYGFEAPVEAAFALTPRLALVVDLRARARAGLIVQDLLRLGMRPAKLARLPQCSSIEPFRDAVEALGWMYVVEREDPSLLRDFLANARPDIPLSFLSAPRTDRPTLDALLANVAPTDAARDRVVAAACEAFECRRQWFARVVRVSLPNIVFAR
jgi:heme oxygenase